MDFIEFLANLRFGAKPVDAIPPIRAAFAQPDFISTLPDRLREMLSTQAYACIEHS
jgi:hypothetical protein